MGGLSRRDEVAVGALLARADRPTPACVKCGVGEPRMSPLGVPGHGIPQHMDCLMMSR